MYEQDYINRVQDFYFLRDDTGFGPIMAIRYAVFMIPEWRWLFS